MAAGQPVISVDAKKREQVGNYGRAGREWAPGGEPVTVRSHDFPDKDGKHAIPYGVYDEAANTGFVNVGTDGNTAALAVESVRRWWRLTGKDAYPGAARLLVTADAGGSNGYRARAWKAGLAELARETGLDITVCHFPPGTSKWNKIEHRLFCHISLAWRGRPLTSYDVIVSTIGAVTTANSLACTAVLDENRYPTGTEVSDAEIKNLEDTCLTRHAWHGDWNYTLLARPAPPPPPPPPARPPRPVSPGRPQPPRPHRPPARRDRRPGRRTGNPDRARREQRPLPPRPQPIGPPAAAHPRTRPHRPPAAILIRRHLDFPGPVIATLLGTDRSTLSHATSRTGNCSPARAHPPAPRASPRETPPHPDDLREYAARHGITITRPPTLPQATLATQTHRQLSLFLNVALPA